MKKFIAFIKKVYTNIIFINFFPVILVNLLFLLFWILEIDDLKLMSLPFNAMVTPIYLVTINLYIKTSEKSSIFLRILFMIIGCLIGIGSDYFSWGITGGNFRNPDWGTVILFKLGLFVQAVILTLGIISKIITTAIFQNKSK